MQFFAWNCSNFGDIKTAMMTNLLVILYVLNWLQTSGIRLSEVSADRLELWVKQTSNFQVDRDGLGADEAAWAEGDAKRNQRNVGGGRLYLQTCKCLESSKNFWCPRVLEKKSFIYQETTTLMGFLGLLSPIRIFVGPLGITCFCQTNLGKSPLEGWFICHQACATPCHGEAQWLVVPCWMYFVFMGILGANWHWHPWNKALKRVFLLVATQVFFISPRNLGEMDPFWRAYFSKGLVQPPTRVEHGNFLYFLAGCALEGITLKFPWLFDFFCFSLSWRFFFGLGVTQSFRAKQKPSFWWNVQTLTGWSYGESCFFLKNTFTIDPCHAARATGLYTPTHPTQWVKMVNGWPNRGFPWQSKTNFPNSLVMLGFSRCLQEFYKDPWSLLKFWKVLRKTTISRE